MKNSLEKDFGINVATLSTSGHYVVGSEQVICLDGVSETFYVKGKSKLTTKNHTDLQMDSNCLIVPQQVYNPYLKSLERSKD